MPAPPSSFVGRASELAAIGEAFESSRLVTLVGPGGMGKTRLALEHARTRVATLGRADRGGVWFVDLTDATTSTDALAALAAVLELALVGAGNERSMIETVGVALARLGPALLVLDNVEQLAVAAARQINAWLAAAPSARFLVTSRVVLGVPSEHALALGPLRPDEAHALFLSRASGVRALDTRETDRATIDGIVDAIDRMPLAIELAASRTRVLTTHELRERLDRPLEVLVGGVSNDRHASMRGAVLDSLALIDPTARRAFTLLATLDDSYPLGAAEAVLGAMGLERSAALEAVDTLARTSLLRANVRAAGTRYAMFQTIREVALELLASEPAREAAREAHVTHHSRRARLARVAGAAVEELEVDLEHFLTARVLAIARGRTDDAIVITLAVEPFLSRRGLSAARARMFDEVIQALAPSSTSASLRAELHLGRGLARRELGDGEGASADFDTALTLTEHREDAGLHAVALLRVGGMADVRGDTSGARGRFAEAIALLESTPANALRERRLAEASLRLGHAQRREGALEDAHAAFVRAAALHRSLGLDEGLAASLYELGVVAMFREHVEPAFAAFDEGLTVARRSGARVMEGACLTARGCLLQDLGRLSEALAHHAEAAAIFRDHASRYREASALYYLATTYLERGDAAEALGVITQARERLEGVGAPRYDALMSGGAAVACAALGHHARALDELARAAVALAKVPDEPSLSATLAIHRETVAHRLGQALSPDALARARSRAGASPSDDTRFALRELERAMGRASTEAREALCVWGAGESFLTPGGSRVTLPERSPMRRILDQLVTSRELAPGEPVSLDALIEAGWPGEKMSSDAALNRAYVAIASLRKKGLRDAIVSAGGGYAISRGVVVRRMA